MCLRFHLRHHLSVFHQACTTFSLPSAWGWRRPLSCILPTDPASENLQDMRKRLEAARRVMIVGNGGIALELVYASADLLQLKFAAVPTGLVCLVCFA